MWGGWGWALRAALAAAAVTAANAPGAAAVAGRCAPGHPFLVAADSRAEVYSYSTPTGVITTPPPTRAGIDPRGLEPPVIVPGPEAGAGPIEDLLLSRDGSPAWIAEDYNEDLATHCSICNLQVHVLDHGRDRMLASGREIVRRSLAISRGRVYWSEGEQSRQAPIHAPSEVPAPAAPTAGHRGACAPVHAFAIAANARAQIFEELEGALPARRFGCAYGHRAVYPLGSDPGGVGGGTPTSSGEPWYSLAGVMAAYEEGPGGEPKRGRQQIVVRDLVDGHIVHRIPDRAPGDRVGYGGVGSPYRLLITARGDVAWLSADLPAEARLGREYNEVGERTTAAHACSRAAKSRQNRSNSSAAPSTGRVTTGRRTRHASTERLGASGLVSQPVREPEPGCGRAARDSHGPDHAFQRQRATRQQGRDRVGHIGSRASSLHAWSDHGIVERLKRREREPEVPRGKPTAQVLHGGVGGVLGAEPARHDLLGRDQHRSADRNAADRDQPGAAPGAHATRRLAGRSRRARDGRS